MNELTESTYLANALSTLDALGVSIFRLYMKHVEGYCECNKVDGADPDMGFMARIESNLDIVGYTPLIFRANMLTKRAQCIGDNQNFSYWTETRLRGAIRAYLLSQLKELIKKDERERVAKLSVQIARVSDAERDLTKIRSEVRVLAEMVGLQVTDER